MSARMSRKMGPKAPFTDVPTAIEEVRAGRMIVVVDDEDRENEGDLTLAAEKVTPEAINFMAKYRARAGLPGPDGRAARPSAHRSHDRARILRITARRSARPLMRARA